MLVTVTARDAAGQAATITATADVTAPSPPSGDWVRPTAATTGYTGTLTDWTGSLSPDLTGQTVKGKRFGGYVKAQGSNVVMEDCHFTGGFVFFGPGPLTLRRCTNNGSLGINSYYRDIAGVLIESCHVICGPRDGIDLFSDSAGKIRDVTITDTLIDGQDFPADSTAHGDGLQVRGINGLTVQRCVVDMLTVGGVQPQKNAAIYFEDVWGGDSNMHFTDVDIYGGDPYSHTFYTNKVTASSATNLAIVDRGGYVTRVNPSGWSFDNVTDPNGSQINP